MSIADKIKSLEEEIIENKDKLTEATKTLEETNDETTLAVVEELSDTIENQQKSLAALKKAEAALASKAVPVQQAPAIIQHRGTNAKTANPADLLIKSAVCSLLAGIQRVPIHQVMQERYGENEELKAVSSVVNTTKAAQNPAMTTTPSWAGDLVDQSMAAFIDLLRPTTVIPKLPLKMFSFDGYGSIKIPVRNTAAYPQNLQSSFRAEGAPIRVGSASIGSKTLTEKNMAVISTYTDEIVRRSTNSIEQMIREWIIQDSSEALDKAFLGASAAVAGVSPAGMLNGIAALDTAASAGASLANIQADLKGRMQRLASLNMGQSPVWIMHNSRQISLATLLTAVGTLAYPSISSGTLLGAPVVTSTSCDPNTVILLDAAQIAFAYNNVEFQYTNVATLHEESDAATVSNIDGAAPVRSLFQTNTSAIKANYWLDFAKLLDGSVQSITAVAW